MKASVLILAALLTGCRILRPVLTPTAEEAGYVMQPNPPAPPVFTNPATVNSIFVVLCPDCQQVQLLTPTTIFTNGSSSLTNGYTVIERTLNFQCRGLTCKDAFSLYDQITNGPIRAIRLR